MKRVNISITDETHVKAKIISALTKRTLSEYLARAVEKTIAKDKHILKGVKEIE